MIQFVFTQVFPKLEASNRKKYDETKIHKLRSLFGNAESFRAQPVPSSISTTINQLFLQLTAAASAAETSCQELFSLTTRLFTAALGIPQIKFLCSWDILGGEADTASSSPLARMFLSPGRTCTAEPLTLRHCHHYILLQQSLLPVGKQELLTLLGSGKKTRENEGKIRVSIYLFMLPEPMPFPFIEREAVTEMT